MSSAFSRQHLKRRIRFRKILTQSEQAAHEESLGLQENAYSVFFRNSDPPQHPALCLNRVSELQNIFAYPGSGEAFLHRNSASPLPFLCFPQPPQSGNIFFPICAKLLELFLPSLSERKKSFRKINIPPFSPLTEARSSSRYDERILRSFRALSSAGRASPLHGECRGFKPLSAHHEHTGHGYIHDPFLFHFAPFPDAPASAAAPLSMRSTL